MQNLFNPSGVAGHRCAVGHGFHPRLLTFKPFGLSNPNCSGLPVSVQVLHDLSGIAFNPIGVVMSFYFFHNGFHPRLLTFKPFGLSNPNCSGLPVSVQVLYDLSGIAFNPIGVVMLFYFFHNGFHPRLLTLTPSGFLCNSEIFVLKQSGSHEELPLPNYLLTQFLSIGNIRRCMQRLYFHRSQLSVLHSSQVPQSPSPIVFQSS